MARDFEQFLERVRALVPPPPRPAEPQRPQTDEARIALLKLALDQFLLTPGIERAVGKEAWEFALNVREDC